MRREARRREATDRCTVKQENISPTRYSTLPKQDAIHQTNVLGIAKRTISRRISNHAQSYDTEKISHDLHRKNETKYIRGKSGIIGKNGITDKTAKNVNNAKNATMR